MKTKKVLSAALAAILLTLAPGASVCRGDGREEQTENTQELSAQQEKGGILCREN